MGAIDELLARHRAFHAAYTPAEVSSPRPRLSFVYDVTTARLHELPNAGAA